MIGSRLMRSGPSSSRPVVFPRAGTTTIRTKSPAMRNSQCRAASRRQPIPASSSPRIMRTSVAPSENRTRPPNRPVKDSAWLLNRWSRWTFQNDARIRTAADPFRTFGSTGGGVSTMILAQTGQLLLQAFEQFGDVAAAEKILGPVIQLRRIHHPPVSQDLDQVFLADKVLFL